MGRRSSTVPTRSTRSWRSSTPTCSCRPRSSGTRSRCGRCSRTPSTASASRRSSISRSPTKRCGKSSAVDRVPLSLPRVAAEREHHPGGVVPRDRGVEADAPDRRGGHVREDARRAPRDPQRGAHARHRLRRSRRGRRNEPRLFSTWAPKVVAAIGRLPDTIEDRAIRIVARRASRRRSASGTPSTRTRCAETASPFGASSPASCSTTSTRSRPPTVERPDGLDDRAWNNWRPLLTIASAAGGDWPDRARRAALALAADRTTTTGGRRNARPPARLGGRRPGRAATDRRRASPPRLEGRRAVGEVVGGVGREGRAEEPRRSSGEAAEAVRRQADAAVDRRRQAPRLRRRGLQHGHRSRCTSKRR